MQVLLHSVPLTLQQATAHLCLRPAGDSRTFLVKSGSVSCGVIAPFSWVLMHTGFVYTLQESVSPVLCEFWWLNGGINGDFLQEGLCHTQVHCTQGPCPCGWPLLTHISARDTQTLKGRSGLVSVGSPGAHKVLFEPSKHLWRIWSLILNAI